MYTNLHYMFGGNNNYTDYYFGNNYILQKEKELLIKELQKDPVAEIRSSASAVIKKINRIAG